MQSAGGESGAFPSAGDRSSREAGSNGDGDWLTVQGFSAVSGISASLNLPKISSKWAHFDAVTLKRKHRR